VAAACPGSAGAAGKEQAARKRMSRAETAAIFRGVDFTNIFPPKKFEVTRRKVCLYLGRVIPDNICLIYHKNSRIILEEDEKERWEWGKQGVEGRQ
jgi:hypothetical protein